MTEQSDLEKIVLTRLIRLNAVVSGIVTGLISGGGLFVATLWLVIKGGEVVGPHLALLGQFFVGYSVTVWGSVIGFLYGFLTGFIVGFAVAILYNWLLRIKRDT
ncbi:MAG: hypothetical protein AAF490_18200 [Chloroflexota bacterium]